MKIVFSFDSFKGGMSARAACEAARKALLARHSDCSCVALPMGDGGEGTADAMMGAMNGTWRAVRTMGPLPDLEADSGFAWFEDRGLALVEMAKSSGLPLVPEDRRNPLLTTTYGTGQLLAEAMRADASKIWLAVGGSATVDGGVGAAMALGWKFLDRNGSPIGFGGGELERIEKVIAPARQQWPEVEVLCDVDNPLCGEQGAARMFSPQKGASPEMVERLETGLTHLAGIVKEQLGKNISDIPGAGAAGGLSAGAAAFLNARLVSGINTVIAATGFEHELADADWVVTGEGSFDAQSLCGKVISGILRVAKKTKTRIAVIAGTVKLAEEEWRRAGISAALQLREPGMTIPESIAREPELLNARIAEFAKRNLVIN